jgi:hypothetical protein
MVRVMSVGDIHRRYQRYVAPGESRLVWVSERPITISPVLALETEMVGWTTVEPIPFSDPTPPPVVVKSLS